MQIDPRDVAEAPVTQVIAITPRTLWQAAGIVLGLLVVCVAAVKASSILLLVFTAIVLAEGLRPIVRALGAWHVPRPLAILLTYLIAFSALGVVGYFLATPVVAQATEFANNAPAYFSQLQDLLTQAEAFAGNNPDLANALHAVENQAGNFLGQALVGLISVPLNTVTVLFSVVVVLTMAFFWLTAMDRTQPFIMSLVGPENHSRATAALRELSFRLGGFVRGVAVNMSVIGILSGIGIWLLGVPYALLLGIFAGLTEIIPFLGPYFGGSAAVLVALVTLGPLKAVEVLALYVVIQELEGNILVPVVMNRAVQLNPFWVIVAVLVGGELFGLAGSVLAVPLAVVVAVLIEYVVAPAVRRQTQAEPVPVATLSLPDTESKP